MGPLYSIPIGGLFGGILALVLILIDVTVQYHLVAIGFIVAIQLLVLTYALLWKWVTRYEIYPDKLGKETGLVSTTVTDVAVDQITDLGYHQGVVDRVLGTGTISVNTAGSDVKELTIAHVDDARVLYERIDEQLS